MNPPVKDGTALRLATALLLIPGVILLIWLPALRIPFVIVAVGLAAAGARECCRMSTAAGIQDARWITVPLAALLALGAGITESRGHGGYAALLPVLFAVVTLHLLTGRHTIAGLSASVFAVLYTGYCASFFIVLHAMDPLGPGLITFLIAVVGCSDTAAYFIGKSFGRHKLAPIISPNKTVEGAVAALFGAAGCAVVLFALNTTFHWTAYPNWPLPVYLLIAVLLSMVGQAGDLVESLLKRNAGVKNSGALFPGHGGALDRCDAMLFAGPALYGLVQLLERLGY